MDTFTRIKQKQEKDSCCYVFPMTVLMGFLGLIAGVNIYFLIDRRDEIWEKTFYRLGLMIIQQFFLMWKAWDMRKSQWSAIQLLLWILFTYLPIAVSVNIMEAFLYVYLGKDSSYKSRTENKKFPGSQQDMISLYFLFYIHSLVFVFLSAIGFVVYGVMRYCRGRRGEGKSEKEQRDEIQDKLQANKMAYGVKELCEKQCSICQGQLLETQSIIKLQCRHLFHKQCIFQWFLRTNRQLGFLKCPNCRNDLDEEIDE